MFHFGNNQCEWINATVADFPAVFSYLELLDLSWNWQIQNHENKSQFSWGQSTNAIGARCKSRATHHLRNKRNGSEMVTFDNKCTSSRRQKLISWHAALQSNFQRYFIFNGIFGANLILCALTNLISAVDKSDLLLLKCLISFRKVVQLENIVQWQIWCFLTRSIATKLSPRINWKLEKSFSTK